MALSQTHRGEGDGDRDGSDALMNQETLAATRSWTRQGMSLPRSIQRNHIPADT